MTNSNEILSLRASANARNEKKKAAIERIVSVRLKAEDLLTKGIAERDHSKIKRAARLLTAVETAAQSFRDEHGFWPYCINTLKHIKGLKTNAAEALGLTNKQLALITKNARLKEA